MADLIWSRRSAEDLSAIYSHVSEESERAARGLIDSIAMSTDRLLEFPLSGRIVPEFNRQDIREVIVGNYRVVYQLLGEDVGIALVHHGARLLRRSDLRLA